MRGIICICKRCAGTGAVFAGVKPFRFKRCPRCSGKGGRVLAIASLMLLTACGTDSDGGLLARSLAAGLISMSSSTSDSGTR
jgi:hypothetical protein